MIVRPKLVLDTNVLARAIVGSEASLDLVLRWHRGDFSLCVSDEVLDEYRRVLPLVREADADARAALLDHLHDPRDLLRVRPKRRMSISPHPPDNRFIEVALEAPADALLTFNTRHFDPWATRHGIVVSRPREYLPLF